MCCSSSRITKTFHKAPEGFDHFGFLGRLEIDTHTDLPK